MVGPPMPAARRVPTAQTTVLELIPGLPEPARSFVTELEQRLEAYEAANPYATKPTVEWDDGNPFAGGYEDIAGPGGGLARGRGSGPCTSRWSRVATL